MQWKVEVDMLPNLPGIPETAVFRVLLQGQVVLHFGDRAVALTVAERLQNILVVEEAKIERVLNMKEPLPPCP